MDKGDTFAIEAKGGTSAPYASVYMHVVIAQ